MLINLVGNAIKFTHQGSVTIVIKPIQTDDKNIQISFEIIDTGIGISQQAQVSLFDKFTQADSSTTRKYGGTGLGLAICQRLVLMMGGKIGLKSEEGKGSTFWFNLNLPIATRRKENQPVNEDRRKSVTNISFEANILVAEDNQINQMVITQMLGLLGCKVDIANNGLEVVEMVKKRNYDLVFMDCMMPEMNGYEATQEIRRSENNINIIALTANALQGDRHKCLASGMNDYLSKPIKKLELQAMLGKWLNKKEDFLQDEIIGEIINIDIFNDFLELMGNNAEITLRKHCEIVQKYLYNIEASLKENDFRAVADFVHPLKSSSQQIGATVVAELSASVERICRESNVNNEVLPKILEKLQHQQGLIEEFIEKTFEVRKIS